MRRHEAEGLVWYTFDGPGPGFRHALLTRCGGVSEGVFASLNLGSTVGDRPEAVAENHRRVNAAFGFRRKDIVSPHQVHGNRVAPVRRVDGGTLIPATDALITGEPGLGLLLRFADCVPVLFFDPRTRTAGLAHAGWRGTAAGVVAATVAALETTYGVRRATLWAGVGPGIAPEHYEVGAEVVAAIDAALPPGTSVTQQRGGSWYLDLPGAVAAQLRAAGVGQVEVSGLYTSRRLDEWYSHRAEGGGTGRFGVLASIAEI